MRTFLDLGGMSAVDAVGEQRIRLSPRLRCCLPARGIQADVGVTYREAHAVAFCEMIGERVREVFTIAAPTKK